MTLSMDDKSIVPGLEKFAMWNKYPHGRSLPVAQNMECEECDWKSKSEIKIARARDVN